MLAAAGAVVGFPIAVEQAAGDGDLAAHGYAAAWALDGGHRCDVVRVTRLRFPDAAVMPQQGEVSLWIGAPVGEHAVRAIATEVLDRDTVDAADQLQDPRDRVASLAVHASVRMALASVLECAPQDIRFERGTFGKPNVRGAPGLHFSLSHARGVIGFALARWPVGFDVERIRVVPDMRAVAKLAFAEETCAALTATPQKARTALFYRFWTLGEAHIKATGLGISQGLQSFAFTADNPPRLSRATPDRGPPERWFFGVL